MRPVARSGSAGTGFRLLRAAVFTAVCVALSAGGHGLASCAPIPLWTLAAGCAALFAVVVASAGRERSLPGIAAGLAAGQLGLHALFGLGQHTAGGSAAGSAGPDGLIELAGRLLCDSGPGRLDAAEAHRIVTGAGIDPGGIGGGAGRTEHFWHAAGAPDTPLGALLPSPAMVLGHLLAALAAGWLLRRGEVALWRLARLSADGVRVRALRAALRLVRALYGRLLGEEPAPGAVWRTDGPRRPGPRSVLLQHSVIRRGPPHFALAA
ncbi:hypothetical protein E4099_25855 [Streptomyces palmae]|uniref:Integral membrane protein n=1 Tax=Streptomyces palmae TaxID=1701085 RepID=A0A4Z0GI15_9ACTN|nr:hypothetical protein E4099_25855 [Streptomyces palmae]